MNIEIKFRAWDKQTNKMSPDFTLFGEFTLMGAVHAWQHECGNKSADSLGALNDLEIMQYTGLKDKNGKECYASDFVRVNNVANGHDKFHIVTFEDGAFCLRELNTEHFNSAVTFRDLMVMASKAGVEFSFVIIGNQFENPELL